jgi:hypothetical protein
MESRKIQLSSHSPHKHFTLLVPTTTTGRKKTIEKLWFKPNKPKFDLALHRPVHLSTKNVRDSAATMQFIDTALIEFHLERGDLALACYLAGMHDIYDVQDFELR